MESIVYLVLQTNVIIQSTTYTIQNNEIYQDVTGVSNLNQAIPVDKYYLES